MKASLLSGPGRCALLVAPCALAVLAGAPVWVPGIPLLLLGLALVCFNTPWALCFIAFSIMPFCVVQQEIASVTLNLPEVLILLLAAKEGVRAISGRETVAPRLPLIPLSIFVVSLAVALGTGFLRQNGVAAALQDFRQFSEFVVLFWLVVQCVRTREQAQAIAFCFVLGAGLIAAHGIVQQFTFVGISAKQIASDFVLHRGVRSGSFYGATALGGMMVLACGPAIGVLLASRRRWVQSLAVLCIVLCLFAVVFTKTRGSWLGLVVAIVFIGVSVRPSKRILAGAAGLAVVFALLLGPLIVPRIATLADPANDQSLMDRAQYYAAAYQIGRAHPILGLGWGCYYDIGEILKSEGYIRVPRPDAAALAAKAEEEGSSEATVHSAYLQLFVKTGALGAAGFFLVVLVWLERIWRARDAQRDRDPGWALYAGVTASLAGYLFHSTFENFFQWPVMAQSFWLLMGLSFALAPSEGGRPRYRVPAAALGTGAAIFALFMYVCIQLERLHTDNFEQNVARAMGEGDIEKALLIARRATDAEIDAPMPKTVYGRVLLEAGQPEAALEQLRHATGEIEKKGAPANQDTGPAYYFAPARLSLGEYYFEQGDVARALEQFELARANADLASAEFADFHPAIYAAYAKRGAWARALDAGMPGAEERASLPGWSLVQIGRALLDRQGWDGLGIIVKTLSARGEFPGESHYFAGRVHLGASEYAAAAEAFARAPDHAFAAYFLGVALEGAGRPAEAVQAYQTVPEGTVLRAMAAARAAALAQDPAEVQALVDLLHSANAGLAPVNVAPSPEASRFRLLAYGRDAGEAARGGRFPLLLLWEDRQATAGSTASIAQGDGGNVTAVLPGGNQLLQLQWAENRANWESVERAYPGDAVIPGWIDAGRDWFHLRSGPGFAVERAEDGDAVLSLVALSWLYSAPVPLNPGSTWLVLGRLRDPGVSAVFGWQVVDSGNTVLDAAKGSGASQPDGWAPRADLVVPGDGAAALRLVFETTSPVHLPVALDDAAAIEIVPPALSGEAGR